MVIAKFQTKIVIGVYTPNSQGGLARLPERIIWEKSLREYMARIQTDLNLPVILCGDLNCAPKEIDIHNPKSNRKSPGFSDEERSEFQTMIDLGFLDSFRFLNPERIGYSYFSNFANSRARNVGWRIDHILVSRSIGDQIQRADILGEYFGSDHVPILIDLNC
jgi:exodeoxyribonuclease-3